MEVEIDTKIIEHVNYFQYSVAEITMKASRSSGHLRRIVRKNRYLSNDSKSRIYKSRRRFTIRYAVKTRPKPCK